MKVVNYVRRTLWSSYNVGHVSWLLHRITGVALAIYLIPHFASIGTARHGARVFDATLKVYTAPIYKAAEFVLIGAVAYHMFNGLRVIVIDFFSLSHRQKLLFWLVMGACAAVLAAASFLFVPKILAPA